MAAKKKNRCGKARVGDFECLENRQLFAADFGFAMAVTAEPVSFDHAEVPALAQSEDQSPSWDLTNGNGTLDWPISKAGSVTEIQTADQGGSLSWTNDNGMFDWPMHSQSVDNVFASGGIEWKELGI